MGQQFRIEQLWLDGDRPAQPRPMRRPPRQRLAVDTTDRQMALRMVAPIPEPQVMSEAPQRAMPAPPPVPEPEPEPVPIKADPQPFGAWLLEQANRRGTLGELAKAAKLDRHFPRKGNVEAVRARFNAAGADGDAFEALDDAERDYARAF